MFSSQKTADPEVSRFCWQCLQLELAPQFPSGELLCDEEVQETIYERLLAGHVTASPPPRYKLRILKELIARIESSISDWDKHSISDNLMGALTQLLSQPLPTETTAAQQRCYVTYRLSLLPTEPAVPDPHITLLESRSLISASGTTGLRTWEAALHLGQYLCVNPSFVTGKRVLELGAGTGYLAVLCAKYLDASHVIASDGSNEVVSKLPDSFLLNGLQGTEKISVTELKWGHIVADSEGQAWGGRLELDTIIGADITYDASVIPALVETLVEMADLCRGISILIAATERNRATFETFLDVCGHRGFSLSHESFPVPPKSGQNGPFYSDVSPIHICRLGI
ncbi:hypothetical protein MFIFM68171_05503 [Madurella fahalii]|uniref:FAM86 N-terminal domain-containing protein n=1 Tax=Madurella fahalii TaxID=1157608 RepID=A0ABQ0GC31_9PEZI